MFHLIFTKGTKIHKISRFWKILKSYRVYILFLFNIYEEQYILLTRTEPTHNITYFYTISSSNLFSTKFFDKLMVFHTFWKNDNYEQYFCTEAAISFLNNILNQIHVIVNDHWFLQNYNRKFITLLNKNGHESHCVCLNCQFKLLVSRTKFSVKFSLFEFKLY